MNLGHSLFLSESKEIWHLIEITITRGEKYKLDQELEKYPRVQIFQVSYGPQLLIVNITQCGTFACDFQAIPTSVEEQ